MILEQILKILAGMVISLAAALWLGLMMGLMVAGCTKTLSFLPPTSKTYREPYRATQVVGVITNINTSGMQPGEMVHIGRGVGGGAAGARQDIPDHLYTNKP